MKRFLQHFSLFLTSTIAVCAQSGIDPLRRTTWIPGQTVGVPGGIPTDRSVRIDVTQAPYLADNTGNTNAGPAIQAAINAAEANQIVYLPAGTYRVDSLLNIGASRDRITLRGAGMDATRISFRGSSNSVAISVGSAQDFQWTSPTSNNIIIGGQTKDSTQITIADASPFFQGQLIQIGIANDPALPVASVFGFDLQYNSPMRRQMAVVTGKSGNTLTISPGLYSSYNGSTARVNGASAQTDLVGLEDFSIDCDLSQASVAIQFEQTVGCWVKNVRTTRPRNYQVFFYDSVFGEMRRCILDHVNGKGPNHAALLVNTASACLFEDNIINKAFPLVEINHGASGNVFAYNFCEDSTDGGVTGSAINVNHGPHNDFNLYEGNIAANIQSDGFFGGASEDTLFRNWLHGTSPGVSGVGVSVILNRFTRKYNVVGNILGKTGRDIFSYSFGNPNLGNSNFVGSAPPWPHLSLTGTITSVSDAANGVGTITLQGGATVPTSFNSVLRITWGSSSFRASMSGSTANNGAGPISTNGGTGSPLPPVGTAVQVWVGPAGFQELDIGVEPSTYLRANYSITSGLIPLAEVLTGTLEPSLYLTSAPNWFGTLTWPAFGNLLVSGLPNNTDIVSGEEISVTNGTLSINAVDTTNDVLTTATPHGYWTGVKVRLEGTAVPAGVTAGNIYFARVLSATTFALYGTYAQADPDTPGDTTGRINLTSAGTNVTVNRPKAARAYGAIPAGYRFLFGQNPPTAPYFIVNGNPVNRTVTSPLPITISAVVEGVPTPSIKWQKKAPTDADFTDISVGDTTDVYEDVTTSVLRISNTTGLNSTQYRAVATNTISGALQSTTSTPATLTVNVPASITSSPANQTVVAGTNSTSFTVGATGSPAPATFTWEVATAANPTIFSPITTSSGIYSNFTTTTLGITNAGAALNGNRYRAVVSNGIGSPATSGEAILTVHFPPTITTQPQNQTIGVGGNISFTVAAANGNPATGNGNFIWQISSNGTSDWENLTVSAQYPIVTNATLNIVGATADLNGKFYRAIASNVAGSSPASNAVQLTVTSIPPAITLQPVAYFVADGYPTSFTVTATGSPPLTYSWEVSVANGPFNTAALSAAPYTGQGTNTLTISNSTGLNGNRYRVVVSNTVSPTGITSTPALLTISNSAVAFSAPAPANASVTVGGNTSFTAVVTPTTSPAATLQWQTSVDNGTTWNDIVGSATYSGVTTATLNITAASLNLNGTRYRVRGSNNLPSSAISASATLTVTGVAPTIATQPTPQSVVTPANATFTAVANGAPPPTYQWQRNDAGTWVDVSNVAPYSGATTASLLITGPTTALNGVQFRVVATNGVNPPAISNTVALTVANPSVVIPPIIIPPIITPPAATGPSFTTQPSSQTRSVGGEVVFSATATGNPNYQWFKNGAAIAGATSSTLTRSDIQVSDAGSYHVVASNSIGSTSSNTATLNVISAPIITSHPSSQTVLSGVNVTFTVNATGFPALSYQWRKNGSALSGATSSSLSISNVQSVDAGGYDVVITNTQGTATSNAALLAVNLPSYAGTYFGTFSGGGSWALYVRTDNTATYIATLPDRASAIVIELTINADGTFSVAGTEINTLSNGPARAGIPPIVAAGSPFTLTGSISNGHVSGQLSGIGKTMSGAADSAGGSASGIAGFYKAAALVTASGTTYAIVGASGQALVVTTSPTLVDGATGTVGSNGQLTANTQAGGQLTLSLSSTSQKIVATYVPVGNTTPVQFAGLNDTVVPVSALLNLSIRASAGTGDNSLIAGFVIQGASSKTLLIRGIGPTLGTFDVPGFMPDPTITVFSGKTALASNDDWGSSSNAAQIGNTTTSLGAFGLAANSRDAVVLVPSESGSYSAQISAKGGATGVALLEVYDASVTSSARLVNMSARTQVGSNAGVLIVGFVVDGNAPKQILVRAIGPTLTNFEVPGVLTDPQLELFQGNTRLQFNDNWGGTASLRTAFGQVGAFDITDSASRDAALLVTLQPGSYTAIASGVGGTTGVALVEIYILP